MSGARRLGRRAGALGVLLAAAACGGGGGGGGGSSSGGDSGGGGGGSSGTAATLAFTAVNTGRIGGYPLWASEAAMRVGHAMARELAAAVLPGAASSGGCDSGTWQREWLDRDASGGPSAGDTLTMSYAACAQQPLARSARGSVTLTLLSVGSGGSFSGHLRIAEPGLGLGETVGNAVPPELVIGGQAVLDVEITDTRRSLAVRAATAADRLTLAVPGYPPDELRDFRLEKTQRFDEARTVLVLQMRYDSPELGGSFDVRTPVPLRAWFDSVPEPHAGQGLLEMTGRGFDRARVTIIGAGGGGPELGITLDQGGDGTIEGTGSGYWVQVGLLSGYFFADHTPGGLGNTYGYSATEFTLRPPFRVFAGEPVDSRFRVQFTRPPAGVAAWRWRLVDLGSLPWGEGAAGEVPIEVLQQGALFTVRPLQRLGYSRRYELLLDTGTPTAGGQRLLASTGGSIDLWQGRVGSFQTPDHLNMLIGFGPDRVLVPGGNIRLSSMPPPAGAPLPVVRWEQVSGPPLVFGTPDAPETAVHLAPGGHGVGVATVRLTKTLPDGSSASALQVLRTLHDTQQAWTTQLKSNRSPWLAPPPWYDTWGGPATGALAVDEGAGLLRLAYTDVAGPTIFPSWTLELAAGDRSTPLQAGRYAQAWSSLAISPPPGAPLLNLRVNGVDFAPWDSEFEIHEIERDGAGRVTRLAVDVTVRGVGDLTPMVGAVRLNSTRPVPGQP